MNLVVRKRAGIRYGVGCAFSPATRAPRTLDVVGRRGRNVPEENRLQLANINSHLERGRAGKYIDFSGGELALVLPSGVIGQLRRVFPHLQRERGDASMAVVPVVIQPAMLDVRLAELVQRAPAVRQDTVVLGRVDRQSAAPLAGEP